MKNTNAWQPIALTPECALLIDHRSGPAKTVWSQNLC